MGNERKAPVRPLRDEAAGRLGRLRGGEDVVGHAIARAKAGDIGALHFLYVRYSDDVRAYVGSIVRDVHEAEDITQNVFAKLMDAIGRYEQRDVPFTAWIMRVARNAALDHLRSRRAVPCEEVRLGEQRDEQAGAERCRDVRDALSQLPSEQREVLVLRHVAGMSPREIAVQLDKSESAVHGLHHRGRNAMQTSLTALGAAPVTATAAAG